MHELTPDPVEALRLSSALLALLPECKGATHSEAVSHCAECCFGSGYELHGPEDQAILDAATFLAALAALPAPEEPPPFGSVPFGTMFIPGPAFLHGDNEWIDVPGPITVPPKPLADPAPVGLSEGARLIAAERERQVAEEGWTPEHDAEHEDGSILDAASSYVSAVVWVRRMGTRPPMPGSWPWDDDSWKPSDDPVRNLVKAGALIAAEIDRLSASTEEGTDG